MIEVCALSKRYGDTVALHPVTFDVRPGVVTGLLGPNGAGKSTLMRMILGLDLPTTGWATVAGRPYRELAAPMREVGALLDAKAVQGGRTARAHLRWLARAGGIGPRRVEEVLDLVGLVEVAHRRLGGFSLGMSQRLGIAGALLGDPGVVLFDEPGNGLDPEGIRWVRLLLRRLAAEGRTVIVSSHLMNEMQATADHVLVLGRGRLIADADIVTFTRRAGGERVRVVSPDASRLAAMLTADGAEVTAGPASPTVAGPGDWPSADSVPAGPGTAVGNAVGTGGAGAVLLVTGSDAARIGDLAAEHRLRLHELTPTRASLETAYLELTRTSAEYTAAPLAASATIPHPAREKEPTR